MNDAKFFAGVRSSVFGGSLNQGQVGGCNVLLRAGAGLSLPALAYVLATAYHETAHTMQPIEEYGRGKGRDYGVKDPVTGQTYYGRGYVQLTWKANYRKAGVEIGVDLVSNPGLAMQPDIAATIIVTGMGEGWFTGKKLADYFGTPPDWKNARRIVNGTDKADLIAGYGNAFLAALQAAQEPATPPMSVEDRLARLEAAVFVA